MWRVNVVITCKNGRDPTVFRRCYLRDTEREAFDRGQECHKGIEKAGYTIIDSDISVEEVDYD